MSLTRDLDHLYKRLFVKMVAGLVKNLRIKDITIAEDIVQDTFIAAQTQWQSKPPDNPEAWLFKVCKNIALKMQKSNSTQWGELDDRNYTSTFEFGTEPIDKEFWMLVACANPRFSAKQQVVFSLRYAAGFKVDQIATLLGSLPETITKTLQRLRKIIKEENIQFYSEEVPVSRSRQRAVLMILYLMFSEGYKTSHGKSLLNETLCEDALSFVQLFINNKNLTSPESRALYALMLFNLSRFEARFTSEGELVDLENQDRKNWNLKMINLGVRYLNEAQTEELSSYHIEAAVAFLHCTAQSFTGTDWNKIVTLYEQLSQINESPFVKLNLAIAKFYSGDNEEAQRMMADLGKTAFINHYYLYHVALGKMYSKSLNTDKANVHFSRAIELTNNPIEKRYISKLQR